jgi:hypothetical protein
MIGYAGVSHDAKFLGNFNYKHQAVTFGFRIKSM